MSVYSLDKLMSQARQLAVDYRNATGKTLAISAEIARHDVARLLDLDLVDEPGLGYDAVGRGAFDGQRIQIKGRAIFNEERGGHRIGQLKLSQTWDAVALILMDDSYEPFEIHLASREAVEEALTDPAVSKRNSRGAMSVARFKIFAQLIWTRERGLEDDGYWSNQ